MSKQNKRKATERECQYSEWASSLFPARWRTQTLLLDFGSRLFSSLQITNHPPYWNQTRVEALVSLYNSDSHCSEDNSSRLRTEREETIKLAVSDKQKIISVDVLLLRFIYIYIYTILQIFLNNFTTFQKHTFVFLFIK